MSKILELLNYNKKRVAGKREKREDLSDRTIDEDFDSNVKEKLANTYIFNPANASEHVIRKQGKEAVHKHVRKHSQGRFMQLAPWLIAFLTVMLLLVNIAYRGKVNIKVEFLNNMADRTAAVSPEKNIPAENGADEPPIFTPLISDGYLNSYIIKKLGFYGAAISKSRMVEDGLYLFNDGATGWASAGIDLPEPMDFSNTTLDFFVKGGEGNESLKLILRDSTNNSYMPQAYNVIFNKNMGTDWQFTSVPFGGFEGAYNPKKINHIGFEFGTQTTSNKPGSLIHIKKIKIVKSGAAP